ncbi:DUF6183 family protein [Streptomyces racemochromogenes]|uniref:DUF6183 family protein n=1 Tax=Streptomyces racemochromogenes TaxID=67353 RepID=UPI0031EC15F5
MEDVQFVRGEPERRAAEGDVAYLRELGARLADGYEDAARRARTYQEQLAHADVGATARFEVALTPLDDVWQLLFASASMGGVYDQGVGGAWGRMWAWRSMSALSGAPALADAEEVERWARETTWFRFEADSGWFHNETGTDFAIAALSPDRRRLAVLAATDTD